MSKKLTKSPTPDVKEEQQLSQHSIREPEGPTLAEVHEFYQQMRSAGFQSQIIEELRSVSLKTGANEAPPQTALSSPSASLKGKSQTPSVTNLSPEATETVNVLGHYLI